jgi:uncharacterized protein YjbJ (UPF0337 family)
LGKAFYLPLFRIPTLTVLMGACALSVVSSTVDTHYPKGDRRMNKEQIQGKWEQMKGYAQEKWGKLTDDDIAQIKGRGEQLKGKLRERYGLSKEEAEDEYNRFVAECELDERDKNSH